MLRNSEDKIKNKRGGELLDLCKVSDLLILNGRTAGDIFGKFTCHNWNGSSVVDYFIVPYEFIDNVASFNVGEYIPWLSDHCTIGASVRVANASRKLSPMKNPLNCIQAFYGMIKHTKNIGRHWSCPLWM